MNATVPGKRLARELLEIGGGAMRGKRVMRKSRISISAPWTLLFLVVLAPLAQTGCGYVAAGAAGAVVGHEVAEEEAEDEAEEKKKN